MNQTLIIAILAAIFLIIVAALIFLVVKFKAPSDAKAYLNFITILASHKNADAKLIAFMSNELKKKNPEYVAEIDYYEQLGTSQRKK